MNRLLSIFCGLLLLAPHASAQRDFLQKVDSLLILFQKTNTDTNYIVRPEGRLTIRLLSNFSGAHYFMSENLSNAPNGSMSLHSNLKWTLTTSVNYRGLSLALSANPGHLFDWYHDFELNVNAYGNKMGVDFIFQRTRTMEGDISFEGETQQIPDDLLNTKTVNANYYYVFNHRRFSYPAAFTQSFIQKRSAGSFIVGVSFESMQIDVGSNYRWMYEIDDEDTRLLNTQLLGIGAGYGYNFVPNARWMIHMSALPTIVVWRNMHMEESGFTARGSHPFSLPNMLTVGRFAAIHYFRNQFAGLTAVVHHSHLGQSGSDMTDHFKWRVRVLYGIRF